MSDLSTTIAAVDHRLALAERLCEDQPSTPEGRQARVEIMQSLVDDLTINDGARITYGIRIAGIDVSSTISIVGAVRAWLRAARALLDGEKSDGEGQ